MIEAALAALRDGDLERLTEFIQPDFELDLSRRVLNPDVYRGVEGVARFRAEVDEIWDEMRLEPLEVVESGTHPMIRLRAELRGKGSGVSMSTEIFQVWILRDAKLARAVVFQDRAEAERLAGLS